MKAMLPILAASMALASASASAAANDSLIFQDFGSHAGQNSYAAAKGVADSGKSWVTGGWWYQFGSAGTLVKDSLNRTVGVDSMKWLWSPSQLHAKLVVPNTATGDIYLGIGTGIMGDGTTSYDLTGLTGINVVAKGTGNIRLKIETKDALSTDLADNWGTYGFILALTPNWKTYSIPVASLVGTKWSALEKSGQDITHGIDAVYKVAFQISDTTDVDFYLKSIVFKGITLDDVKETGAVGSAGIQAKTKLKETSSALVRNGKLDVMLNSASDVAVYDLMGNSVLSFGRIGAGAHSLSLSGLKNGAYIVRLSASEKAFPIQVIGR